MYIKLNPFCLLWVVVSVCAENCMNVGKFRKREALVGRSGYSKTQFTRSKIQCAAVCEQEDACHRYSYDNNVCKMGDSASGPDVMHKVYDNCPTERGYSLWTYEDMQLCLKYYSSEMNHPDATSTCANDGGHLVLVESEAVRERIRDALGVLGVTSLIWLDGYDASPVDNLFLTWKGVPLTWVEWETSNPHDLGGDECLMGSPSDGYKIRDEKCQYKHVVVCQIDVM